MITHPFKERNTVIFLSFTFPFLPLWSRGLESSVAEIYFNPQQSYVCFILNLRIAAIPYYNFWNNVWINRHTIDRTAIALERYLRAGRGKDQQKHRHTLPLHSIPNSQRCTSISPDSTLPLTHATCYFDFYPHILRLLLTPVSSKQRFARSQSWFIPQM